MKKFTKKMKIGASLLCTLAVLGTVIPTAVIHSNTEVNAADEYYRVATKLYDYYYDDNSYDYDHDKDGDGNDWKKTSGNRRNGDRWWQTLQVPYESFNREISQYYQDNNKNKPALYFGNFAGSRSDQDQAKRHKTWNTSTSSETYYQDAYSNFDIVANNGPAINNGKVATQGLVDNKLVKGNITQGGVNLPLFDTNFINSSSYATMYTMDASKGFPFKKTTDSNGVTKYSYDSRTDGNVYYSNGQMNPNSDGPVNFTADGPVQEGGNYVKGYFPFNNSNIVGGVNTDQATERKDVNYGFGMRVDIPFNLTSDGTINGQHVVFNFSGDDDVWVYIDGVLMLDIGGQHGRVEGKIDFAKAANKANDALYVSNVVECNYKAKNYAPATSTSVSNKSLISAFEAANNKTYSADEINELYENFFNPHTEHTMTVFYMERGMFESNLMIDFNFVPVPNDNTYTLREETKFDGINKGLVKATQQAADADIFEYAIVNNLNGRTDASATDTTVTYPVGSNVTRKNTDAAVEQDTLISDRTKGTSGQAYKFTPNSGDTPVASVKYQLTDPFANPTAGVTDNSGNVKLMYGESARFASQFTTGSTMTVVQNNTLQKAGTNGAVNATDGTRTITKYYTTTSVTVKDKNNAEVARTGNQFNFANVAGGEPTQITQTFVNTPKTGSIQIKKNFAEGTGNDTTTQFEFQVQFSDVFGDENADTVDYANIKITISGEETTLDTNGRFKMTSDKTATISGIPFDTKYVITETGTGNYITEGYTNQEGKTTTGTTEIMVTNKKKEAEKIDLTLTKTWGNISATDSNMLPNEIYIQLLSAPKGTDTTDLSKWTPVDSTYKKFEIKKSKVIATVDSNKTAVRWTYTFQGLDKTKDYMILEYTQDGKALILEAGTTKAEGAFFGPEFVTMYTDNTALVASDESDKSFEIMNTYDAAMPKTGGEGVRFFAIFGTGIVLLAGGALFLMKRKTAMQSVNGGEQ